MNIVAKHKRGPLLNGGDGCHARFSHNGICPGHQVAEWLNSLGPDKERFRKTKVTNGAVRQAWLRGYHHIQLNMDAK